MIYVVRAFQDNQPVISRWCYHFRTWGAAVEAARRAYLDVILGASRSGARVEISDGNGHVQWTLDGEVTDQRNRPESPDPLAKWARGMRRVV